MLVGRYGRNTLDSNQLLIKIRLQIEHYVGKYNVRDQNLRVLVNSKDMHTIISSTDWVGAISLDHQTLRPRIFGVLTCEVADLPTSVVLCDV